LSGAKSGCSPSARQKARISQELNPGYGGPIVKDKLWWFYSFRDQSIGLATQMLDAAGNPGAIFETSLMNHTIKTNYQINPSNSVFFTGMTSRKLANRGIDRRKRGLAGGSGMDDSQGTDSTPLSTASDVIDAVGAQRAGRSRIAAGCSMPRGETTYGT
jgi:hypothetical protein